MKKATFGLDENVASALSYLTFIAGIIFFVSEKDNKEVRFHAFQSVALGAVFVVLSIVVSVLSFIPILGTLLSIILSIVGVCYGIGILALMFFTFQGSKIKIPIIADIAEKQA